MTKKLGNWWIQQYRLKHKYTKDKVNLKYNQHLKKILTAQKLKNMNSDCIARIAEMKEISFILIIIQKSNKYHTTEKIESKKLVLSWL